MARLAFVLMALLLAASAAAAEKNPAPSPERVRATGCVEPGVEAGCLIVKDRKSGRLYNVLIRGVRPAVGDGIEFTGVPHDGPTICMQGIALDVISWARDDALGCKRGDAPER